jgi:hypothetical protein
LRTEYGDTLGSNGANYSGVAILGDDILRPLQAECDELEAGRFTAFHAVVRNLTRGWEPAILA